MKPRQKRFVLIGLGLVALGGGISVSTECIPKQSCILLYADAGGQWGRAPGAQLPHRRDGRSRQPHP